MNSLAIGNQLSLQPLSPAQRLGNGAQSSTPLTMTWLPWQSAPFEARGPGHLSSPWHTNDTLTTQHRFQGQRPNIYSLLYHLLPGARSSGEPRWGTVKPGVVGARMRGLCRGGWGRGPGAGVPVRGQVESGRAARARSPF